MTWNPERIRDLRLRLGFSTSDMARRLECTCTLIKTWEAGQQLPTAEQLQLLDLLLKQAEACADETAFHTLAETVLANDELGQVDLTSVKRRFSENN